MVERHLPLGFEAVRNASEGGEPSADRMSVASVNVLTDVLHDTGIGLLHVSAIGEEEHWFVSEQRRMAGNVSLRTGDGIDLRQGIRVALGVFPRKNMAGDLSADCAQVAALRKEHAENHLPQIAEMRTCDQAIKFLTGSMNGLVEKGTDGDHREWLEKK